jgi:putative spermidine/putrescine transport system substrate-binding protein
MTRITLPRRTVLTVPLAGALAAPWIGDAHAQAGEVFVRNPGGAYDESMRKHVYDPFTRETGIKVTAVAATAGRLLAMFRANNVELDVIDSGDNILENLRRLGALAPIDYGSWRSAKAEDITPVLKLPTRVGNLVYSSVIAYSKEAFPNGTQPKNWADFWNVQRFPGRRSMPDMSSGNPHLEFCLLADGVTKDKLYPLDIDRAFRVLGRIRASIPKFWDTGALSAQLMSDKEVVLASVWNGRIQVLIDRGAPLGIEWADNMIEVQALGLFKDARNGANGQKLIEYYMRPQAMAGYCQDLTYGPTNKAALPFIPADQMARMPGSPEYLPLGFYKDIVWWEDNRERVNRAWSRWILG